MRSSNTNLTRFGKYVAKAMTDRNLNNSQLAAMIGVAPQYLSYILHGYRSGKTYIQAIIAALDLDPRKVEKLTAA